MTHAINEEEAALTAAEQRVFRLVIEGYSNREIATRIFVSENTVKYHLKNVYGKLGARRRCHAVQLAKEHSPFEPSRPPDAVHVAAVV